jgi:hypothetical protein
MSGLHGRSSGEWEQRPRAVGEQVEQRAVLGLEPAPLGVGETGGRELEGGKLHERLAHALEAFLDPRGEAAGRGVAVRLRAQRGQRVAQQLAALPLGVGGAQGGHESQRLALGETMASGAGEQPLLVLGTQGAQRVSERGSDASLVELVARAAGQARGQRVAARHPGLAPAEQASHRGRSEAVVAHERVDDARLVHGAEGARRCVGAQQQGLALERRASLLDDDGHRAGTRARPARQALEAVDDLEAAVLARHHAQRQLGEARAGVALPQRTRAQRRPARAQVLDAHVQHARPGKRLGRRPRARRRRGRRAAHGRRTPSTRTRGLPS